MVKSRTRPQSHFGGNFINKGASLSDENGTSSAYCDRLDVVCFTLSGELEIVGNEICLSALGAVMARRMIDIIGGNLRLGCGNQGCFRTRR